VTGVRARSRVGEKGTHTFDADLVIDASGRGSPSPAWLSALGYQAPREQQIKINVGYTTRQYRRLPHHLHGKGGAIIAACRPDWRFGVILSQEGDRWIVTIGGYLGDQVKTGESGFVEFARSLPKPEIFDVVKDAEPLSPLMPYQFSANIQREQEPKSPYVFTSERGAPFTAAGFARMIERAGSGSLSGGLSEDDMLRAQCGVPPWTLWCGCGAWASGSTRRFSARMTLTRRFS
jgi:hypothetical protein